jgi:hypothetical protein
MQEHRDWGQKKDMVEWHGTTSNEERPATAEEKFGGESLPRVG